MQLPDHADVVPQLSVGWMSSKALLPLQEALQVGLKLVRGHAPELLRWQERWPLGLRLGVGFDAHGEAARPRRTVKELRLPCVVTTEMLRHYSLVCSTAEWLLPCRFPLARIV